jgi:hypothetical protein
MIRTYASLRFNVVTYMFDKQPAVITAVASVQPRMAKLA